MTPKLIEELKRRELLPEPGKAEGIIRAGRVTVDGDVVDKPGAEVGEDAAIEVDLETAWPSRAGNKLDNLLGAFPALAGVIEGAAVLDLGCGHGGFSAVLLDRGAERVYAVDVGWGQLVPELRGDDRVTVMERTNLREVETSALDPFPGVVTSDISFTTQFSVLELLESLDFEGLWIGLFKPQFELPEELERRPGFEDGVVTDAQLAAAAWEGLASQFYGRLDYRLLTVAEPAGTEGNREFFFAASRDQLPPGLDTEELPEAGDIIRRAYMEEGDS